MSKSYEISLEAENDWYGIIAYTFKNFGERQVQKYTKNLLKCLDELVKGGGKFKELVVSGHRVQIKRCQKHYIFALIRKNEPLLILAVFHEQMDLMIRLKNRLK